MFYRLAVVMIAAGVLAGISYGQLSVTITSPGSGDYVAPFSTEFDGSFKVSATVTNPNNNTARVIFYQNDVPTITDTSAPFELTADALGQDVYTYRARVCDTGGNCAESNAIKLVIHTPQVVRLGQQITLNGSPVTLEGPGSGRDHTDDIRNAIQYLGASGGTIFFPCKLPQNPAEGIARYNIRETIDIPSNITLQGEGADEGNRCQISWSDIDWNPGVQTGGCFVNPTIINGQPNQHYLLNKPMFRINGGSFRVRFKDMWMLSQSESITCWRRNNSERIRLDNNTAIEMNTKNGGSIKDVIFENISITTFTKGISAISDNTQNAEISNIKLRGYRPMTNDTQLYIDAKHAYDWDVQNLNVTAMLPAQKGVVDIINAGKPTGYTGMKGGIKFLQLNCNGNFGNENVPFCVQVEKHGGLYFRQLHHEGVNEAIVVKDISGRVNLSEKTNPDPIVFDASIATGKFYDASMKLYLIGGAVAAAPEIASYGLDEGRLRFYDNGTQSTVVNCGEVHTDVTPVYPTPVPNSSPTPSPTPQWHDLKMLFTHSERNRGAFFAETSAGTYIKPHTTCPAGVPGLPETNTIGGEYFDSGNLPTEIGTYSNVLNAAYCPGGDYAACMEGFFQTGGSVFVDGSFIVNRPINVPSGSQILGTNGSTLRLVHNVNDDLVPLLRINVLLPPGLARVSNIVIRDLALKTQQSETIGISIANGTTNTVEVASDFHFNGVSFQGFDKGIYAGRMLNGGTADPMIDGISFKNLSFYGNKTAVEMYSGNSSNWNVMNLRMESSSPNAEGWFQTTGGHQGFQRIACQGTPGAKMNNCLRLMMGSIYVTDLERTQNVINALTVENSLPHFSGIYQGHIYSTLLLRNSDFTAANLNEGRVKIQGKAFITSMNNKYQYFDIGAANEGNLSRLTYCGDAYTNTSINVNDRVYTGLAATHPNLWVWVPTPTRIECGTRAVPWEDAVRLGGQTGDRPLVGNFSDNLREDFVIYRPGTPADTQSKFLIKQAGGPYSRTINWGTMGDIALVGKFHPNSRSQIVIFRPSTGDWWAYDPKTDTYNTWHWGQSGDIPLIGNFLDESPAVGGNMDELAVYRPGNGTFYIQNPRSLQWIAVSKTIGTGHSIQVGDFHGFGYDQIADYDPATGDWDITDPITLAVTTADLTTTTAGDVPVPGKYFSAAFGSPACTQIGVWRPGTQQFVVEDAFPGCGGRNASVVWGSNNDFAGQTYADDIPLTISTADGTLRRPVAYRPTRGAFPESVADGQWWVHDPLIP